MLISLIALTQIEKGALVLYFSNNRASFWNYFFRITNTFGEAYAFIVVLIASLFIRFRYALAIPIAGLAVMFISRYLKDFFGHPRPSRYFAELVATPVELTAVPEVELVSSYTTSFPSGHTTAAFTLYTLLAFFYPKLGWQMVCLLLASLSALARVYLGQHFLEDIAAGAFTGFLIALGIYLLQHTGRSVAWMNRGIFNFKQLP